MNIPNKFCFTKPLLSRIPIPPKRKTYSDLYQSGLALIVTYGGTKAFYLYKTINKRSYILKIGDFPDISIEDARAKVACLISDIKSGKNQLNEDTAVNNIDISLSDFFIDEYKPKHLQQYTSKRYCHAQTLVFNNHLKAIENKCLKDITRQDIELLHKKLGVNNGHCAANRMLGLLQHIFNTAIDWGYININPAVRIKPYKEKSRDRFIQPDEMSRFMKVLSESNNDKMRDFIMLLLLTGQRGCNVRSLKWSDIDFYNGILYLSDTKNGESQRIPLTGQAIDLLHEIKAKNTSDNDWIFPSDKSKSGHIETSSFFWRDLLIQTGIKNLRMHDLRRTMGSYQAITGSSLNIIGKSLGHKSIQATAIYAKLDLNPVRDSMQRATNEIFKLSQL